MLMLEGRLQYLEDDVKKVAEALQRTYGRNISAVPEHSVTPTVHQFGVVTLQGLCSQSSGEPIAGHLVVQPFVTHDGKFLLQKF